MPLAPPARRPVRRLALRVAVALALGSTGTARAADFVGSETCRSCHVAAWEAWRESPHARALSSLSPEQQKDARCLQCHAPTLAAGGDPGVTCESCHGAGEYYWPAYVMRDPELSRAAGLSTPDGKSCVVCHDASSPSLVPFDVESRLAAIDHWSAERAARKAAGKAKSTDARPAPHAPSKAKPPAGKPETPVACDRKAAPARKAAVEAARPARTFLARALRRPAPDPSSGTLPAVVAVLRPAASSGAD